MTQTFLVIGSILFQCILASVYLIYRLALPKPIPGIPYNKTSASRLLGDIPDLAADTKRRGDVYLWFLDQNMRAGRVMNQIFIQPFGPPAIILADGRETRDILVNRTADFDRSHLVRNLLRPVVGRAQITLPTGPTWKAHRRLVQDTMSAKFLNNVAAPNIHASCQQFVALWEQKAWLADGRPFDAELDMFQTTLDAVLVFTFGEKYPHRAVSPQLEMLAALSPKDMQLAQDKNAPVVFPRCQLHPELDSFSKLVVAAEDVQEGGLQHIGWFFKKMSPQFRASEKIKNEGIRREIACALERMSQTEQSTAEDEARNSADLIVNRERIMASRENRQPKYFGEAVQAEACYDITSCNVGTC